MLQTNDSNESRLSWFTHARFGMFIHWGIYAVPARGEWVRNRETISDEAYQPYFNDFNPDRYDPRAWARLARRAGMKYAVITSKHHDGFCLFDSKLTDFKAANTPAKRDLLLEFVEAFRGEGLKVGFYHSLLDWHHPHYPIDDKHPMRDDDELKSRPRELGQYVDYLHGQVRELLTNYGKIDILWFDFSYGNMSGETWRATELAEMVRGLQPHIILNNRLMAGHEQPSNVPPLGDFSTPEQIIPPQGLVDAQGNPRLWEACITINDHWGYCRDDQQNKSPAQLLHMLVECVSKGGNLLLNVGPTARGEIPEESAARLEELGRWMDRNAASIHGCGPAGLPKPDWGRLTRSGNTLYAHVLDKPTGPIALPGLAGKVRKARLLRDGSEVSLGRPWNAAGGQQDLYMKLPGVNLSDPLDTVVALELEEGSTT